MSRRTLSSVTAVTVVLTMAVGCGSASSDTGAPAPAVPSASAPAPTTAPTPSDEPSASPSAEPTSEPAPSASETPAPAATDDGKLKRGEKGEAVVALQKRLTELGYWNGKADGSYGSLTRQAVYALQKAAGLGRDGVVGPKTRKALDEGVRPKARSSSGRVVEISKKRQLLMIVDDGEIQQVFNTSTGSYEHYEHEGNTYLAATPSGKYAVSRQIDGWRDAPLGLLWRPKYFNGGIAVHGAYSVPPYAASHGCARLSIAAMNWIWANDKMPIRTKVWVY
jgi:peptidoglycan hydrolase-like protein with peptidoglycan-binding domain